MVNGYMENNHMDATEQIQDILNRLEKLEHVVFQNKIGQAIDTKVSSFIGTKGGILLLISKGYFVKLRSAPDVRSELAQNAYHFSIQVVQTALNRLSKAKGPLVTMRNAGKKVYVKRK